MGAASEPWAGPASAGKKNRSPKSGQIRDPGWPWQPSKNSQNPMKTLGKQGILENVDILVATEIPRNLIKQRPSGFLLPNQGALPVGGV